MFGADLRKTRAVAGPEGVTLFYAQTSFRAATRFGGGGYAYSHPVAVRHDATGAVVPIRDDVMAVRLGLLALIVVAAMTRWIHGG
jgi:hypothetical protein